MRVGDLVFSLIRRQISGGHTETRILQEVLAIDKAGYPTHSCSMGNPNNETPSEYNSKEFQHIVDYEALSKDEAYVVRKLPQRFTGKPLDEPFSHSHRATGIEIIKLLADYRELIKESP